jgi:hypothetical protein
MTELFDIDRILTLAGKKHLAEKWKRDYETPKSKRGMWDGWSKARLEKRRDALRAKTEHTDAETKELEEINFALRAKNDWGKAD